MWRILPLMLCALLVVPVSARAADDEDETEEEAPKPKKKKKKKGKAAPVKKGETRSDEPEVSLKPKPSEPPVEPVVVVEEEAPSLGFARHRYGYVLGGGFLVTGLAFAYSAQGEAKRAETIGTAREASQALNNARASASTANVMYGLAATSIVVALLFELIPEPAAEKASLTFHF